MHTCPGWHCN